MSSLVRYCVKQDVTVTNSAATCEAVLTKNFAGAGFINPSAGSNTSITFWVAEDENGTFRALYDSTNTAVAYATVANSRAYPVPDEVFGFGAFKMVGNDAGPHTLVVSLKS